MYSLTLTERIVLSDVFTFNLFFWVCLLTCFIVVNLYCSSIHIPNIALSTRVMHIPHLADYIITSVIAALLILFSIILFVSSNPEDKEKRMIVVGEVILNNDPSGLNLVSEVVAHSKNTKVIVILNSNDEIKPAMKALGNTPLYNVLESFLIFDKGLSRRDNLVAISQGGNLNFLDRCKIAVLPDEDKQLSEHLETYNINAETIRGRDLYIRLHNMRSNKVPFKFDKITFNNPTEGKKCGVATIDGTVVKQKKGDNHENT